MYVLYIQLPANGYSADIILKVRWLKRCYNKTNVSAVVTLLITSRRTGVVAVK